MAGHKNWFTLAPSASESSQFFLVVIGKLILLILPIPFVFMAIRYWLRVPLAASIIFTASAVLLTAYLGVNPLRLATDPKLFVATACAIVLAAALLKGDKR